MFKQTQATRAVELASHSKTKIEAFQLHKVDARQLEGEDRK